MFKFDANTFPIMGVGVEGDFDRVACERSRSTTSSPRLERVPGVASVTVDGGLRRQIHVLLSKEKIRALNLSVDRVVNLLRTENQNIPLGEIDEGDRTYLVRSQGQFDNLDDIRDLVVMTRGRRPVYMQDIAEVKDATEDFRSFTRINGRPGVRLRITKQSGTNTVADRRRRPRRSRADQQQVPGIQLSILDDSSVFIIAPIDSVKEHAALGGFLVILIIFLFLRDLRSTLIVFTSIPISVIGTFALLYFNGFTLNTMTFGGLALGIGMIVDASIVVLENTFRHMENGKDRMQAAIDGQRGGLVGHPRVDADPHRGLRAAALPHRRVEHAVQAALDRRDVLARRCRCSSRSPIVPVLCSRAAASCRRRRKSAVASSGGSTRRANEFLNGIDDRYRRAHPPGAPSSADGPRVRHRRRRRRRADPADDRIRTDAADRRRRGLGHGGAAGGNTDRAAARKWRSASRALAKDSCRRPKTSSRSAAASAAAAFMVGRWRIACNVTSPARHARTSGRARAKIIARDLNRQLPGHHSRRHHPDARFRRQPPVQPDHRRRRRARVALEIRGDDLRQASRSRNAPRTSWTRRRRCATPGSGARKADPSWPSMSTGRRPRCSV